MLADFWGDWPALFRQWRLKSLARKRTSKKTTEKFEKWNKCYEILAVFGHTSSVRGRLERVNETKIKRLSKTSSTNEATIIYKTTFTCNYFNRWV